MAKYLLVVLLACAQVVYGWQIETKVDFSQGTYNELVSLYCDATESLCQSTCATQDQCQRQQFLCFNCIGLGQPLLRILFTQVDQLYLRTAKVLTQSEIQQVFVQMNLFVAAASIFNYYTTLNDLNLKNKFLSLCPSGTNDVVFVLSLKDHMPAEITHVICSDPQTHSSAYVLEYYNGVTLQNIN